MDNLKNFNLKFQFKFLGCLS